MIKLNKDDNDIIKFLNLVMCAEKYGFKSNDTITNLLMDRNINNLCDMIPYLYLDKDKQFIKDNFTFNHSFYNMLSLEQSGIDKINKFIEYLRS